MLSPQGRAMLTTPPLDPKGAKWPFCGPSGIGIDFWAWKPNWQQLTTKKNITLSLGPHLGFRRSLFSTAFSIRRRRCLAGHVASFEESKVEENVEMGPWNVKDLQYILGFDGLQYDLMVFLGFSWDLQNSSNILECRHPEKRSKSSKNHCLKGIRVFYLFYLFGGYYTGAFLRQPHGGAGPYSPCASIIFTDSNGNWGTNFGTSQPLAQGKHG